MGALGKQIGICPYYASRAAVRPAEIVTLPYPLLLQKSAREALGISLKGHVIIIDEAHNLMDAISGIHGVEVSLKQLKRARGQLGVYLQKFRNRLKGKNRVYIAQVVRVIDSLAGYLESRLALQVRIILYSNQKGTKIICRSRTVSPLRKSFYQARGSTRSTCSSSYTTYKKAS